MEWKLGSIVARLNEYMHVPCEKKNYAWYWIFFTEVVQNNWIRVLNMSVNKKELTLISLEQLLWYVKELTRAAFEQPLKEFWTILQLKPSSG